MQPLPTLADGLVDLVPTSAGWRVHADAAFHGDVHLTEDRGTLTMEWRLHATLTPTQHEATCRLITRWALQVHHSPVLRWPIPTSHPSWRDTALRVGFTVPSTAEPYGIFIDGEWRECWRSYRLATPRAQRQALTPREHQVLTLICQGMSNKAIASSLHLSENTVKNHVRGILETLRVSSRTEAAMVAITDGWIRR